jgi:predicted site-specific integrase-resolvase
MKQKEKESPPHESLLTVQEVANILRVDTVTVNRWIRAGVLDATELPKYTDADQPRQTRRRFRIKKSTIDKMLQEK